MKKQVLFVAAIAALFFATGCDKKNEIKKVSAVVTVDDSAIEAEIKPDSYNVVLLNNATSIETTAVTENGIATVDELVPGNYTVTVHATNAMGGYAYSISGSASASIVTDGTEVVVKVASSKESALVLKEIYHSGISVNQTDPEDVWSGTTYFRDQFYEIYNNSTETVYADGLCFGETEYANWDYSLVYQWDIENADQYVFVKTVWQIPGNGTQYPIAPGESIIVAQWATNHNAENLADGQSIDLSGAEFEAIEGESTLWNGTVITDGPAINMVNSINVNGYKSPQWLISVFNASFILFLPSSEMLDSDFIASVDGEENAREVKIADVIDAVQWKDSESDGDKLHLPTVLDAGFNVLASYSGKSISRKVKETRPDGTKVYQDTNNTTNDFVINDKPVIRRDGAKVPSWSTWNK